MDTNFYPNYKTLLSNLHRILQGNILGNILENEWVKQIGKRIGKKQIGKTDWCLNGFTNYNNK